MLRTVLMATIVVVGAGGQPAMAASGTNGPAHGLAMHGAPKYAADFTHFDYVNPDAPKGGAQVSEAIGTYDSLNAFIISGNPAVGVGLIYDSLTVSALDEPFTQYCLLCETMEVPDDRSWVEYTLREDARWHDGMPITVEDVIFSFNVLREQGHPFYRAYYSSIADAVQTGPRKVRFTFGGEPNPELPLIIGELTIFPKHYWDSRDFTKTTLEPPLGSSAYRIGNVKPGRSITYKRVEDYWAKDHPTQVGLNNVDTIRFDYFRDRTISREAFKAGAIDIWRENGAKEWATAFDFKAREAGLVIVEEIPHQRTQGMQGFVFNLRKPLFQDPLVREALVNGYDFEWYNANLAFSAYTRTNSYFANSELASRGLLADAGAEEREILEGFRGRIPEGVFNEVFVPPATDGSGARGIRGNLRKATALLKQAGWVIRDGKLLDDAGRPLVFEILLNGPSQEKNALPFTRNLKRLGIEATVRTVDSSQYQARVESFDFDMIVGSFGQSLSPGNEQRSYFHSSQVDQVGTRNVFGITDPVIDELIGLVISAPDRESLVQRTRALDRVLLWGYYLVPHFHIAHDRYAFWDKFGRPDITPLRGAVTAAWWIDPVKAKSLPDRLAAANN
ncbi:MAG: extracellular solute-binding protein [Alphaproteobacteria bacterium]